MKKKYGLSLYDFMIQKVEMESLYHYEIAELLDISAKKVGRLSKHFGFKKKNGFKRRFDLKYGKGALKAFDDMIEISDCSLSDVPDISAFPENMPVRSIYIFTDIPTV